MNTKEELINRLDPNKVKCIKCKEWFTINHKDVVLTIFHICHKCYQISKQKYLREETD